MSLNFKIDSRDRVWLLWSNSIRLASEMPPGRETFTHVGSPINIGEMVSDLENSPASVRFCLHEDAVGQRKRIPNQSTAHAR